MGSEGPIRHRKSASQNYSMLMIAVSHPPPLLTYTSLMTLLWKLMMQAWRSMLERQKSWRNPILRILSKAFNVFIHGNSGSQIFGYMINNTNDPSENINNRIRSAHQAFGKLCQQFSTGQRAGLFTERTSGPWRGSTSRSCGQSWE